MKCEKCGGNLTLEDVVCPFCDTLNEHAIQHIRDMNRFKREFEGTKDTVQVVAKNHSGIMVRIVTICVLVVLIIVCRVLSEEAYSIRRSINQNKANEEVAQNREMLLQYLKEGDFYSFSTFFEGKDIATYEGPYDEFDKLRFATIQYTGVFDSILKLLDNYEYTDYKYYLERLEASVNSFYRVFDEKEYYYVGKSGWEYDAAKDMESRIKALLVTYLGIESGELESLEGLTDTQRRVLIEESYQYEE